MSADDEAVLASIHGALKPGGIVIVTVPQHMWLWSATDEQAMHKRRYTRRELTAKLEAAGLEILKFTSFVTVLLPVMYASRLTKRQRPRRDFRKRFVRVGDIAGGKYSMFCRDAD